MSKGENITKRKDGRWEARYVRGHHADGTIHYGYVYGKTYREAKDRVLEKKVDLAQEKLSASSSHLEWDDVAKAWLNSRKPKIKPSTLQKYESTLNCHLNPYFSKMDLSFIQDEVAEDFCQMLLNEKHLSNKTVKDILIILRSILDYAPKMTSQKLPCVTIHYPRIPYHEMRVLSRREQDRLVHALEEQDDPCSIGILLSLMTGLRIGEICALQWKDISIDEGTLTVSKTLIRLKTIEQSSPRTKLQITLPKSDMSKRTIPLSSRALELCQAHRQEDRDYILTATPYYMDPRTLQNHLQKTLQACRLEGVHFHTLRHTFATRSVEAGVDIKCLSMILGHASVQITMDRYVHASMEMKKSSISLLKNVGL